MKIRNIKILTAGHIMDKGLPARLDDSQEKLEGCVDVKTRIPFPFFTSPDTCKYLEIGCLISKMSKHCNNDYTQCQTYKFWEKWGK